MRRFFLDFLKNFLRPWKQSGRTQVMGWANLAIFACVFASFFVPRFMYLTLAAIIIGTGCMLIEQWHFRKEFGQLSRRIKRTKLTEKVLSGQIDMDDLSPADQENVRIEMARVQLWLKEREEN